MKIKEMLRSSKGEGLIEFAIAGVIGFILLAVILMVTTPILAGVQSATNTSNNTASWGAGLAGAQANTTSSIISGLTLSAISEIVIPAVVILGILMIGLVRRK